MIYIIKILNQYFVAIIVCFYKCHQEGKTFYDILYKLLGPLNKEINEKQIK